MTGLVQVTIVQTQVSVHQIIVSFDLTYAEDVIVYLQVMKTVLGEATMPESLSVLLYIRWGWKKKTSLKIQTNLLLSEVAFKIKMTWFSWVKVCKISDE